MTTTITTGNNSSTNFVAYLQSFNDAFDPSGRGMFSNGIMGDYGSSETAITETPDLESLGFVMRDNIVYDMTSHTLNGQVTSVDFGSGLTATEDGTNLSLANLDYKVELSPELDGDAAVELIYGLLDMGKATDAEIDAMIDLLIPGDVAFYGAGGDDTFTGTSYSDVLVGKGGGDTLHGGDGGDALKGGAGHDMLYGENGKDTIYGGNGHDTLYGGNGKDTIYGGKGHDTIYGGNGKDTIFGGKGPDTIFGGNGNDTIDGGGSKDTIDAGAGRNKVTGGKGADTFVFSEDFKKTTITDFGGKDKLDFSDFAGEATSFDAFMDAATEKNGRVIYDVDGDGENVIVLLHTSLDDLSANDFIF
ncbi:calcium-binding protein [Chachezhania sediminis]|uniref:calcium-binding protein n=1 Tax=Chachezhania sediminis TaxID=2599291 RepID=UPI00131D34A0|nr:calcium-binding protein [Chachezhania sediminis]